MARVSSETGSECISVRCAQSWTTRNLTSKSTLISWLVSQATRAPACKWLSQRTSSSQARQPTWWLTLTIESAVINARSRSASAQGSRSTTTWPSTRSSALIEENLSSWPMLVSKSSSSCSSRLLRCVVSLLVLTFSASMQATITIWTLWCQNQLTLRTSASLTTSSCTSVTRTRCSVMIQQLMFRSSWYSHLWS